MKNNKGFTFIELLAVIVLLGLLMTIGITSLSKYIKTSREKSYRILSQSIYEAYENCTIEGECSAPTPDNDIEFSELGELVNKGYLDNLKNPYKGKEDCTGSINISATENYDSSISEYVKYKYDVTLYCDGMEAVPYTWPDDKKN